MISASSLSKTIFLSSDTDELCNRIKVLLQEKQAGNNSDILMMNLGNYAENQGKRIVIIFVLIDPKRKKKEDIVFVMKVKTHI